MPTNAELAKRILVKMGVLDPIENPDAKDSDAIVEIMTSVYDGLKELGHAPFVLTSIPNHYLNPFVVYVAWHAAPDFGVEGVISNVQSIKAEKDIFSFSATIEDERINPVVDF